MSNYISIVKQPDFFLQDVQTKTLLNLYPTLPSQDTEYVVWNSFSHQSVVYQDHADVGEVDFMPYLNCLDQEDPELIQAIRENYLVPPATGRYYFSGNRSDNQLHTKGSYWI